MYYSVDALENGTARLVDDAGGSAFVPAADLPPGAAQQQPGRPCPHQLLYKAEKVFIQTGKICPGRHQRDGQHQTGQKQGAEEQYLGKDAIQNGVSCAQTFEHESASCVT